MITLATPKVWLDLAPTYPPNVPIEIQANIFSFPHLNVTWLFNECPDTLMVECTEPHLGHHMVRIIFNFLFWFSD